MSTRTLDELVNQTIRATLGESRLLQEALALSSAGSQAQQQDDKLDQFSLAQLAQAQAQYVEMGRAEKLFWVLLFSTMVLVAAGGNTVVVYIVSTNKEMKSVTNYFLVNLSLADTMVSILNVVFNFISMLISHWPFGLVYCKISNFIAILSISASVFTLTAISCDRYNAILHPLRPRMSHKHAVGWILLIWSLSSALASPNAIYSTLVEERLSNEQVAITCTMIWPDGRYPTSSHDHIYNIIIMVVTYLVPIITMAILYYKVGKELWGSEAIGENIDKQQRALLAKKKIVKMMIVVVIIFALCWLPYHAFFVINYYVPNIFQDVPLNYQRCYLIMYWLAMSNSMYNPIIIYFMNSNFRHEFKKILSLICCCRAYQPPIAARVGTKTTVSRGDHTIRRENVAFGGHPQRPTNHHHHHHLQRQQTILVASNDCLGLQNGHGEQSQINCGAKPKLKLMAESEPFIDNGNDTDSDRRQTTIDLNPNTNNNSLSNSSNNNEKLIDFNNKRDDDDEEAANNHKVWI